MKTLEEIEKLPRSLNEINSERVYGRLGDIYAFLNMRRQTLGLNEN